MIYISSPPEDNATISRDAELTLALHLLEEYKVQNLEKKEQMIIRDGKFATMMQHQEENKAQIFMEKEQRAMISMLTGKALLLVHNVFSLHHFLQYSIPQNLGVVSKLTTLAMDSIFFFSDRLLRLQAVFRVSRDNATVGVG